MTGDVEKMSGSGKPDSKPVECETISKPCWQLLVLGFFTGIGGALIGVGGGIIMIPFLTMWGLPQKRAQGTSLVIIAIAIAPIAVITYAIQGNIDFYIAIPLAIGGVIGSVIGSRLALTFTNALLSRLFGIFLIIIVIRLGYDIFSGLAGISGNNSQQQLSEAFLIKELVEAGILGVLAGAVAGFFGVGGGVIFVPAAKILLGLTQEVAQGSSLTAMIPTVSVAMINYIRQKQVDWVLVRWMAPGALVGAILGSVGADFLGKIKDGYILTGLFCVFLLITAIRKLTDINSRKNNV